VKTEDDKTFYSNYTYTCEHIQNLIVVLLCFDPNTEDHLHKGYLNYVREVGVPNVPGKS
jgi:hypothetical protein